jgi:transcriptional regulator with XRE-family HTH domain
MTGTELRERIDRLGLTYIEAARLLGLSRAGLNHQMRGVHPVSRQTEIVLERLEADHAAQAAAHVPRGRRRSARCDV